MFVATRTMTIGRDERRPGRPVEEAKDWDPHTIRRLVEQGYMREMSPGEAEIALKEALADERLSAVKSAQKKIRKAKERLRVLEPELKAATKVLREVEDKIDEQQGAIAEGQDALEELDAVGMPELSDRQARAKARLALLRQDADLHGPKLEAVPEPEPDSGTVILARLNAHTKAQLLEMAENEGIAVSSRMSKGEIVEAIAEALANKAE